MIPNEEQPNQHTHTNTQCVDTQGHLYSVVKKESRENKSKQKGRKKKRNDDRDQQENRKNAENPTTRDFNEICFRIQ